MIEVIGRMPKSFAIAGKQFNNFFEQDPITQKYHFKRIRGLKHYPLLDILIDKYRLKIEEANMLADFLGSILKWKNGDRATA